MAGNRGQQIVIHISHSPKSFVGNRGQHVTITAITALIMSYEEDSSIIPGVDFTKVVLTQD